MNHTRVAALISAALFAFPFATLAQSENQPPPAGYCPQLSQTLTRGMRDSQTTPRGQVSELQKFLADYYDLDPDTSVTGYFGRLTQQNVIRFQREQNLPAYGIVGPLTRAAIARVCGQTTVSIGCRVQCASSCVDANILGAATCPGRILPGEGCYEQTSRCERQLNGQCGWTPTTALAQCLANARPPTPPTDANQSCIFSGQIIAHGASVTAYQSLSVAYGSPCISEQRTCSNGILSGSYQYASCTVQAPLQSTVPIIISKSTDDAYPGGTITITGTGFTGQNDILLDNIVQQTSVASTNNGTTLSFLIPASYPGSETSHVLTVRNQNGTSNGSTLRVHARTTAGNVGACTYKGQTYQEGQSVTVTTPLGTNPYLLHTFSCDNGTWVNEGINACDWVAIDQVRTNLGCSGAWTRKALLGIVPRHGNASLTVTSHTHSGAWDSTGTCLPYSFSWGDGATENVPARFCPNGGSGYDTSTHTYIAPGSYTVSYSNLGYTTGGSVSNSANIRVDGPVASIRNQSQFANAFAAIEPILQAVMQLFGL